MKTVIKRLMVMRVGRAISVPCVTLTVTVVAMVVTLLVTETVMVAAIPVVLPAMVVVNQPVTLV